MGGAYATAALNLGAALGPIAAAATLGTGPAERGPFVAAAVAGGRGRRRPGGGARAPSAAAATRGTGRPEGGRFVAPAVAVALAPATASAIRVRSADPVNR